MQGRGRRNGETGSAVQLPPERHRPTAPLAMTEFAPTARTGPYRLHARHPPLTSGVFELRRWLARPERKGEIEHRRPSHPLPHCPQQPDAETWRGAPAIARGWRWLDTAIDANFIGSLHIGHKTGRLSARRNDAVRGVIRGGGWSI